MPEFLIQAGALRRLAATVGVATTRRSTIPILEYLCLSGNCGVLVAAATDMEIAIGDTAEGTGHLPVVAAPHRALVNLLRHVAPEETITLSIGDAGQLVLRGAGLTARVQTLPVEDFPTMKAFTPKATFTLPAGELRNLLRRPLHAVCTHETRYYLNGVYLHLADGALAAVATDGHRMFLASCALPDGAATMPGVIIPRATVRAVLAHLDRLPPEAPMTLEVGDARAAFIGRTWRMDAKMIDGTFPDYQRIVASLPTDGARLRVDRPAALAKHAATVTALIDNKTKPIKLANGTGMALTMTLHAPETGDCTLAVPDDVARWATNGEHPTFGVQARYLRDLCAAFPGGFTAQIKTGADPIRCDAAEGLALLMPMRV